MPGPLARPLPPALPAWADPKQASVFDYPGQGLLRKVVGLLGLDDPNQVMALGIPLETGAMTGGLIDAVAQKLPRFAQAIKAFHGTPHEFPAAPGAPLGQFKSAAIGTGEGAQAFGHGLYFAENEQVAEGYRAALGKSRIQMADGASLYPAEASERLWKESGNTSSEFLKGVMDAVQEMTTTGKAPKNVPTNLKNWVGYGPMPQREGFAYATKQLKKSKAAVGHMYEVGIDAHPDHLLDWDQPLSQQTEHVRKAFPVGEDGRVALPNGERATPDTLRGESLYHAISEGVGGPAEASAALRAKGIPGIKYFDGNSRTVGEGTRNFVVFDEKTIDILKKYGIAATVAGTGAAAAQDRTAQ